MGSKQKNAVNAFLEVISCDDGVVMDRWIPDEDWVRQIRDNGERYCSVLYLNKGLNSQCMWQNNRGTLGNTTILYNKKYVQISDNKKKMISFYYVMSAGQPSSSVPSDQG
jgi:hypothetical protein